jgi:hypothetical protein
VISQYKELAAGVKSYPLSKPDALNGIQWNGVIQFTASAARDFPHGELFVKHGLNPRQLDVWSEWKAPQMGPYTSPCKRKTALPQFDNALPESFMGGRSRAPWRPDRERSGGPG